MGYLTKFRLTIGPIMDELVSEMIEKLTKEDEGSMILMLLEHRREFSDGCKWYNYEEELREFSLNYPGVVFTLEGEGEEQGDTWVMYVQNGASERIQATISYAPPVGTFEVDRDNLRKKEDLPTTKEELQQAVEPVREELEELMMINRLRKEELETEETRLKQLFKNLEKIEKRLA